MDKRACFQIPRIGFLGKVMACRVLCDEHNIVRYIKPTHVENGKINHEAFERRENEEGLSVNWLEYYENKTKEEQLKGAISDCATGISFSKTGKFAEINIGKARSILNEKEEFSCFLHKPSKGNPSHSEILISKRNKKRNERLRQRLLSRSVDRLYPIPS